MAPTNEVPDIRDVDGSDKLIRRMKDAESVYDWSLILGDYISFGNAKLDDSIAIFNMGPAHDCPNLGTDYCQVAEDECYAVKTEQRYPNVTAYRRRQEFLWGALDARTFAKAFKMVCDRKQHDVEVLRINESGDIRHSGDVTRLRRIADMLSIPVYLYTASSFVDFTDVEEFTVNASNFDVNGADQYYVVVEDTGELPDEEYFHCPASEEESDQTCGDSCMACMHSGGSDKIYETLRV